MGTINYYSKNTDIIYSIDQPIDDDLFYDDLLIDLKESFKSIGYDVVHDYDRQRSYPGRIFAEYTHELIIPISYDGIDDVINIYLTFRPLIRSGYYCGYNLDMEHSIEYYQSNGQADDNDHIADYLTDEIGSFLYYHFKDHSRWDDLDRIDEIIEDEFNEWINDSADIINDRFDQVKNDIQRIFATYSDDELVHIGTFSNGEGIYQRREANG